MALIAGQRSTASRGVNAHAEALEVVAKALGGGQRIEPGQAVRQLQDLGLHSLANRLRASSRSRGALTHPDLRLLREVAEALARHLHESAVSAGSLLGPERDGQGGSEPHHDATPHRSQSSQLSEWKPDTCKTVASCALDQLVARKSFCHGAPTVYATIDSDVAAHHRSCEIRSHQRSPRSLATSASRHRCRDKLT